MQRGFLSAKALAGEDGADCARWAVGLTGPSTYAATCGGHTHLALLFVVRVGVPLYEGGLEGSASGILPWRSRRFLSGVFPSHLKLILDLGNRAKRETYRQMGEVLCRAGNLPNTIRSAAPKCARQV